MVNKGKIRLPSGTWQIPFPMILSDESLSSWLPRKKIWPDFLEPWGSTPQMAFKTVLFPGRNICGFVFVQQKYLFSTGYLGSTLYHHPMLRAMMVHLQRKASARIDGDPFYLKSRLLFKNSITYPRPVYCAVQSVFRPVLFL